MGRILISIEWRGEYFSDKLRDGTGRHSSEGNETGNGIV